AGPVFREVADKLMSMETLLPDSNQLASYTGLLKKDSSAYYYAGSTDEIKNVFYTLQMPYADSSRDKKWAGVYREKNQPVVKAKNEEQKQVPDVKGMGLKDALYLLESRDIRVAIRGTGKVKLQSISPGTIVSKNQKLILDLN
ncbi:MAG TPA: PASTA domain-containing protein, partial [Puia sp.]